MTSDSVDQLVQTTNPLGQAKTFSYDLARNLTLIVDAKGQRIEFTYDAASQLLQKVLKDPLGTITDTVSFSYDPLGNLASAADNDSGLTFSYDAVGRLAQAATGATVSQPATTASYTYDASGNRLTMTDPQGGVTSYVYNALNRLTSVTSPQGTSTFAYDALSRRTALNLPNGSQATYTYDAASQLTELLNTINATTISRFAYTYDAVGNRITRTTTSGIADYTYDSLNRLTQAAQPDPLDPISQLTESFTYDPVGNRSSSHLAIGQIHDAANRLLEDSNFTFSYDANGNLVEQIAKANGDRTVYTYNVENQLIGVEKFTVAGGLSPVLTAVYRYDALGRRIGKEVTAAGSTRITRYVYDNEDILLELDGTNAVQARYTHGTGIDEPLIMLRGTEAVFYHADGLGSVWDLTDTTGAAVRSYTYDSFGQLLAQSGTLPTHYTYTGRELDPETGLYYYRARYYDPSIGRFLQEDPMHFGGGDVNLYGFVLNNPVNFIDPLGLAPWDFKGYCRYISGGQVAGAGALRCRVWTPCRRVRNQVTGFRETGEILVILGGLTTPGAGVTFFNIELLREPLPSYHFPTLQDLEGPASIKSAGFAVGPFGWSWMRLQLGSAKTELIGEQAGLDLSADIFFGSSRLESSETSCCFPAD